MTDFKWSSGATTFLTVEGVRLETRCFGPAPDEAPTFILLHEGLGCAALWREFPEKLAEVTGHGVFVYSRHGYGQSDTKAPVWPLDYMSREASDALPRILNAIGLQRGILLGHSDGASIAAAYTGGSAADVRIRGLVLIAPHFFTENIAIEAITATQMAYLNGDLRIDWTSTIKTRTTRLMAGAMLG